MGAVPSPGRGCTMLNKGMRLMFPPLRIGPIELDFPVVQAALSGYSDWAMRTIARRLGAVIRCAR